jgi:hypothetical protein
MYIEFQRIYLLNEIDQLFSSLNFVVSQNLHHCFKFVKKKFIVFIIVHTYMVYT